MGRPPIHPPGTTAAGRMAASRDRARRSGQRTLEISLSPEAQAVLAALKREGETDKAAVERIILERAQL